MTTAMAVSRLKRYLPDPVRRIDCVHAASVATKFWLVPVKQVPAEGHMGRESCWGVQTPCLLDDALTGDEEGLRVIEPDDASSSRSMSS